jgi:hypothetical protein
MYKDINRALGREPIQHIFVDAIESINNITNLSAKRCIYLYGEPGVGKTQFVYNILNDLEYDIIRYTITDIKNKDMNDILYNNGISKKSIKGMFTKTNRKNIIVIDDNLSPDTMEKNILSSFIKLVRPKKNKRQMANEICITIPIVCICNYSIDKYTKPLMDASICIYLPRPNTDQLINFSTIMGVGCKRAANLVKHCNGDLRTLSLFIELGDNINMDTIDEIMIKNNPDVYTKKIIEGIINNGHGINYHEGILNEQDGNIGGLLIHENIVDVIDGLDLKGTLGMYYDIISVLCKTDVNDRYIFRNQSWGISEPNNILKIMYPGYTVKDKVSSPTKLKDIRFTKILNKHNIEHNNITFLTSMSNKFLLERDKVIDYVIHLRNHPLELDEALIKYEITSVEIARMFKYIDGLYNPSKM